MSKLLTILLVIASFSGFAQAGGAADFTTVMVDGQVTNSKLEDMDGKNVLLIEKLIRPQEVGSNRNNVIVKVTTKPFAIKQYQKKLSGFSKEYKAYLDGSKGDDTGLMYVLNGTLIEQPDSIAKKLYEIPVKKVKSVSYLGSDSDGNLPIMRNIVVITTKKN